MQKIRNRSNFFQKIFHIRYISKNSESVQVLSGILPKILKTFSLFRAFFKKSFYGILRQTGHRHFSNILCANSPNSPKLPSIGVISKTPPPCVAAFRKKSEKIFTSPLIISFSPPKCYTFFKKNWKIFISTPTISPTWSDLCANLSLKRLQKKCRAVPLALPPSHRTCIMHTVHMRKIWKCSPFFWKIFNFFQLHENRASLSSSGILPKNLKTVPLFVFFWEKFTTTPTISPTWNCFLDILSSKAIRRKVACIPPLPRLFPKHPPVALLLLEKIQKIFSTPLIIKITPLFCNTLFELFSKIFILTLLTITFSLLFVSPPLLLFWKILPER